jgi:hypothetical protein
VMKSFPEASLAAEIQDELSGRPLNAVTAAAAALDRPLQRPTLHLVHEFDAMPPHDRRAVEECVTDLLRRTPSGSAADVLTEMAKALSFQRPASTRENVGDLHLTYVLAVADRWRQKSLRPTRSHLDGNPDHKSRFHRFLELVLRDHLELNPRRKAVPEDRYAWLISDKDLKAAASATYSQKKS